MEPNHQAETLESLRAHHYKNVLQTIYANAAVGDEQEPLQPTGPEIQPVQQEGAVPSISASWRGKVAKRLQLEEETVPGRRGPKRLKPLMAKSVEPVRRLMVPKFPHSRRPELREPLDNASDNAKAALLNEMASSKATISERIGSHYSLQISKLDRKLLAQYRQVLNHETMARLKVTVPFKARPKSSAMTKTECDALSIATYQLQDRHERLYNPNRDDVDRLVLDLFDNPEDFESRTPEQWMSQPAPIQATALWCMNHQWVWLDCHVLAYDPELQRYTVKFTDCYDAQGHNFVKRVRRLSLCFDAENQVKFFERRRRSEKLRDEARSYRRYRDLIDAQDGLKFAPPRRDILQGVVQHVAHGTRVVSEIIRKKQASIETLLGEVRSEYTRSQKQALIHYNMMHPEAADKFSALNLPEFPPRPSAPFFGTLDVARGPRLYWHPVQERLVNDPSFSQLRSQIEYDHFTLQPEVSEVFEAMLISWEKLSSKRFLSSSLETSALAIAFEVPVSAYKYQDQHDNNVNEFLFQLQSDWRESLIHFIRDKLSNVFDLFIRSMDEYRDSELQRFLLKTALLMRTHLANLVMMNLYEWGSILDLYTRALFQESPELFQTELPAETESVKKSITDPLHAYQFMPGITVPMSSLERLFLFRLTSVDKQVAFMPDLDSIRSVLTSLLDLPIKLQSFLEIDSQVVPLLGLEARPLCSPATTPDIFAEAERQKSLVKAIMDLHIVGPQQIFNKFSAFDYLLKLDCDAEVKKWFDGVVVFTEEPETDENGIGKRMIALLSVKWNSDPLSCLMFFDQETRRPRTYSETRSEILRFLQAEAEIYACSPNHCSFPMITVDCEMIKDQLVTKARDMSQQLLRGFLEQVRSQTESLNDTFAGNLARLSAKSRDVGELAELKEFVKRIDKIEIPQMLKDIETLKAHIEVLNEFNTPLPKYDFELFWKVVSWPKAIKAAMQDSKIAIQEDNIKFKDEMVIEQEKFQVNLAQYKAEVKTIYEYGKCSNDKMEERASQVDTLQDKLDNADKLVASFNDRERLFDMEQTEYLELEQIKSDFEPVSKLWSITSLFHNSHTIWMTGAFIELDPGKIELETSSWWKDMYRLEKVLADRGAAASAEVASLTRAAIADFRLHVPTITNLRNPGLRPRHWQQISELLGQSVVPDQNLSWAQLLTLDINAHQKQLEEVCVYADKEYALEQALDKMEDEWKQVNLKIVPHKSTGTYKIVEIDDALTTLDDHIVKTQTMRGSPYIKAFDARIKKWEGRLILVSKVIEEWLACQKTWLYLDPIFSSDDIMRQMPVEARRFQMVDQYWRKTMAAASVRPNLLEFVSEVDNLLKGFAEANKMLDLIQRGLNEYLETKRLAFPRFFFLSNDELLEILSQTKDPNSVQPHLSKCFENIVALNFNEEMDIIAMRSAEQEVVKFHKVVNPVKGPNSGKVELWLGEVESAMRESLQIILQRSLQAHLNASSFVREKWLLSWPGQIVLTVDQIVWTSEVEESLQKGGSRQLKKYLHKLNQQLNNVVDLVRSPLSELDRMTLGALVVIDVHARDSVQDMIQQDCENTEEFAWKGQLRYYMEDETVKVKMINASIDYAYEYLGNSNRLVITPLTDRCYRTLMGALHLHLGGAPEGPAGTGKTETVKDLAKAVAKQCVVFNCSDSLDYLVMAKFFKGLIATGAWACFDEFNRIDLEVLSVVAQQIQSIQRAINDGRQRLLFEGTDLALQHSCAVFITMNPGYAGRSELPDNLKSLFRTVAMMVPDYSLIAEIVLYSYGYNGARTLARKIVAGLRLASEQLSSQDHYDFGMRTVKSILTAAGALKRDHPHSPEDQLCLRAINDCNLPKFTADDVPLFIGITRDLFPSVTLPTLSYTELQAAMVDECSRLGLELTPAFQTHCINLFETSRVRHGLMIVGRTLAGKTSAIRVLSNAMKTVNSYTINPKSLSMGKLYGEFDPNTREWKNGIITVTVRECSASTSPSLKWVIFDGPVDAIWIENMNTVLDDNKKLCLASGEVIKLSKTMTMMFEVEDLSAASPATVSRCGMVYMEPEQLGLTPLLNMWLYKLPLKLIQLRDDIRGLFNWLARPCLEFSLKRITCILPASSMQLCLSLFSMFDSLIKLYFGGDVPDRPIPQLAVIIECLFGFSVIWTVGANTNAEGRSNFDKFVRSLFDGKATRNDVPALDKAFEGISLRANMPSKGSVYDYMIDPATGTWRNWIDTIQTVDIPEHAEFQNIIVPTVDTIRNSWLLSALSRNHSHVLLVGSTGTGKTLCINQVMSSQLPRTAFTPVSITFSARSTAAQTQEIIDAKTDRRRKGVFGPPPGKHLVVFVDDLSMPNKDQYGAQPPIELLRQWMDHGGWYVDNEFRSLVDVQFITAMGSPGGGRNVVTNRFLRHFVSLTVVPFNTDSLHRIYNSILKWWLGSFSDASISGDLLSRVSKFVDATVSIYDTIAAELLPTPAKSHYTFNLRDLSKVFQGILSGKKDAIQKHSDLVRLWVHECSRVFADRLVDESDAKWFKNLLQREVKTHLGLDYEQDVLGGDPNRRLIFCDFVSKGGSYVEVTDTDSLRKRVSDLLEDYNAVHSSSMELVLFEAAIDHVTRIVRVLRHPYGNALLVGIGGSGRQSLTRLATFAAEYNLFTIEAGSQYDVTEWRDDLKKLLMSAGVDDMQQVFMLSDHNLKHEAFLEDINNILNNGEVPNLFLPEELSAIIENIGTAARTSDRGDSPASVFSFFVERCRKNIHIVLCLSPIGDSFRERIRQFPALVNCCTINWFHRWPEAALRSVAERFLRNVDVDERVIDVCVALQESAIALSTDYKASVNRHNYVTATSYLSLLKTFANVFELKRSEIGKARDRYMNGLTKLAETSVQVKNMQEQLELLRPQLIQSSAETEELLISIQARTTEADAQSKVIEQESQICNAQAAEAQKIKDECQVKLDAALPAYESAMKALKVLKKNDIVEVKAMKTPPTAVVLTMETICIMLDVEPIRVGAAGQKTADYWETAKKSFLGDPKFLTTLQTYDKDNIPPKIVEALKPYMNNPEFVPEKVKKASVAAQGLCKWVRALYTYNEVAKEVEPMKNALASAEESLAQAKQQLAEKIFQFQTVQQLLKELKTQFEVADAKKRKLEDDVQDCSRRLERAEKLIGGLGGEKERWTERSTDLSQDYDNVVGNIIVSSGVIAYLGAFTSPFRDKIIKQWKMLLQEKQIAVAETFALGNVMGDQVEIRNWIIQKLPKDQFSIDNAVIMKLSILYPLMIDPQAQAYRWICNREKRRAMKLVKDRDFAFARALENCLQFGTPLLIEDVGETLNPILEPVLTKQTLSSGGRKLIKLGDATVEFDPNFTLYMVTKLANPHYTPEISTKVVLVNFMVTPEGLEDQMLGSVVLKDEPKLEQERNELIISSAEYQRQLSNIEDEILQRLSSAQGNILDNEELIAALGQSNEASKSIEKKVQEAAVTEARINKVRSEYQDLAAYASNLFFCISELSCIDPMYQYSLDWFLSLYLRSVDAAGKSPVRVQRTTNIGEHFIYALYRNVCRSLFENDKLLFSFLLCARTLQARNELNSASFRFLLTGVGNDASSTALDNPAPDWLTGSTWLQIQVLAKLPGFHELDHSFVTNIKNWRRVYDCTDPYAEPFPEPFQEKITPFQRLCVIRCIRLDKLISGVQSFVGTVMGKKFVEPPAFNLSEGYEDTSNVSPLVFILSPGADPVAELYKFAESRGFASSDKLSSISLGQGQGVVAEAAIASAIDKGTWVLLQNCHLAVSWMKTLEKIVQDINPETAHPDFRLWLTSKPSERFPISILQNGVKITNEPPRGIRANMLRSFASFDANWFAEGSKLKPFRRMLFGLCFFHAVVQERRKFGPLGWNISYEFNASDLSISVRQLRQFLESYEAVPLQALRYLTGELNYGGRVTDENDRRTMNYILRTFYNEKIITLNPFSLSPSGVYKTPPDGSLESIVAHIKKFPLNDEPEVFGLNDNADISSAIAQSNSLLEATLTQLPRSNAVSTGGRDALILKVIGDIQGALKPSFIIEQAMQRYPVDYSQSLNTVLVQELKRYNRLLSRIFSTLTDLSKALFGQIVMSHELENLSDDIFDGRVPRVWSQYSYPSLKPLRPWIADLTQRLTFFQNWIDNGTPNAFWISGFFFTQSFLTGTLQNYARTHQIPIDTLSFTFEVMPQPVEEIHCPPSSGCYVYGMFLEGARWDPHMQSLAESHPRVLLSSMPVIWLKPTVNTGMDTSLSIYPCPVYKTSRRAGTLSTTGHSTNYVLTINLPSRQPEDHWVKRGVALVLQLD